MSSARRPAILNSGRLPGLGGKRAHVRLLRAAPPQLLLRTRGEIALFLRRGPSAWFGLGAREVLADARCGSQERLGGGLSDVEPLAIEERDPLARENLVGVLLRRGVREREEGGRALAAQLHELGARQ